MSAVTTSQIDVAAAGDRIEQLLEASAAAGPVMRERSEELVRLVVELYGAGLQGLMEVLHEAGVLTDHVLGQIADDALVASLLLVHGLHPFSLTERIEQGLDEVRPYLDSHGGDVTLLGVDREGVVSLRLTGSCDGCSASASTLELAVEDAVRARAPEVLRIEATGATGESGLIPVEQLTVRLRDTGTPWVDAGAVADLPSGGLQPFVVDGQHFVVIRLPAGCYAYVDACSRCRQSLTGAVLARSPATPGSAVLTCPGCAAHFDVRRAGLALEDDVGQLEPVPLLERGGRIELATRRPVPA